MQLRSAVLCGFPDAAHDAGTSPQLQLHSAGIQLQPVLQRQIGFSKITYFGEDFFFPHLKKQFLLRKQRHDLQLDLGRCWMPADWSLAPSILFYFSTFLERTQHPMGLNSVRLKCWQSRLQACCSRGETIRSSLLITSFLTTDFANSNQLEIRKPNHWGFFDFFFFFSP